MKKIVSLLLVLCLACLSVTVFAEAADLLGDWYGSMYGMAIQMTFKDDGTYVTNLAGSEIPGKYELKDGIVYMDGNEDAAAGFAFDGTYLVNEAQNVTLSRDASAVETITIADPDPSATLESYAGSWICKYVSMMGMTVDIDQIPLEQIGASEIPALEIEGNNVKFVGLDTMTGSSEAMEMNFENGELVLDLGAKLKEVLESSELEMVMKVQMLQDGMVAMVIDMGSDISMSFVFTRTEAGAETPAA